MPEQKVMLSGGPLEGSIICGPIPLRGSLVISSHDPDQAAGQKGTRYVYAHSGNGVFSYEAAATTTANAAANNAVDTAALNVAKSAETIRRA